MREWLRILVMATVMIVLDLLWIGVISTRLYSQIDHLRADTVNGLAAILFYVMYLGATYLYAVRGTSSPAQAALRGAGLGLVAYGTYELTNWAVLADWPVSLVIADIAWGIALTAVTATIGRMVPGRPTAPVAGPGASSTSPART